MTLIQQKLPTLVAYIALAFMGAVVLGAIQM